MQIDQDNLRIGIAIGCRASHELCSNYLLNRRKWEVETPTLGGVCEEVGVGKFQ